MNELTRPPRGQKSALRSEPSSLAIAATIEPPLADSLSRFVARAMSDPTYDVDKLTVLLRTEREIIAEYARNEFQRAMKQAIDAMPAVVRDADNSSTRTKYARYETIEEAIRPVYSEHGFYLSFNQDITPGPEKLIECRVVHVPSGHAEIYRLDGAVDLNGPKGTPNKTPLHASASTVSYLRRQLTCMVFNVVLKSEDNDGNRTFPETGELIPPAKVRVLYELLAQCSSSPPAEAERRFLNVMKLDRLASLRDAPAGEFKRLQSALLAKCARMGSPS